MQVTREQRRLAHVRGLQQPHHEPFQADREPAVRRHAMPKNLKIWPVRLSRLTPRGQRRHVVLVAVQPLSPGDQLDSPEQQVERV